MSESAAGATGGVVERLRTMVWGESDTRVRATWRVLLAWPVLWFLSGSVGVLVAGRVIPPGATPSTNVLFGGLIQGAFFLVALVPWARYLDRRPLSGYWGAVSGRWLLDLLVGFCAVLAGQAAWYGLGSSLGWATMEVSTTAPGGALAYGLAAALVGFAVNVWVQETVFVGTNLTNAAEGLRSRGLTPARAVLAAWVVAVSLFALKHRPAEAGPALQLFLGLGVFALLYVHTGELALSIGVHLGVNYSSFALFVSGTGGPGGVAVVRVTDSLSGLPGILSRGAIPQLLVAYLLLLGWVRWRRGELGVETDLAGRTEP